MNQNHKPEENLEQELRQMELATLRELPIGARLEGDTAALREGFLALGQLLEANAEPVTPASVLRRKSAWSYSLVGALVTLAASLVVGAIAWNMWQPAGKNHVAPKGGEVVKENAAPKKIVTPAEKLVEQPAVVAVQKTPAAPQNAPLPEVTSSDTETQLAWDDSLDSAIDAAHERLWTIRHNSFRGDGVYTSFSGSVEQFGQALENDSL